MDDPDRCEREEAPQYHPAPTVITALSGLGTFGFLIWLCWIITGLVRSGIPIGNRADLASTGIIAATGVAVSAIIAARNLSQNPLGFLAGWFDTLKGMVRRW